MPPSHGETINTCNHVNIASSAPQLHSLFLRSCAKWDPLKPMKANLTITVVTNVRNWKRQETIKQLYDTPKGGAAAYYGSIQTHTMMIKQLPQHPRMSQRKWRRIKTLTKARQDQVLTAAHQAALAWTQDHRHQRPTFLLHPHSTRGHIRGHTKGKHLHCVFRMPTKRIRDARSYVEGEAPDMSRNRQALRLSAGNSVQACSVTQEGQVKGNALIPTMIAGPFAKKASQCQNDADQPFTHLNRRSKCLH